MQFSEGRFPFEMRGLLWGDTLDHRGWPHARKFGTAGHTGLQPVIKVGFAILGMGSPSSPTCKGGSAHHLSPPALGCCGELARRSLRPLIKVDAKPAVAAKPAASAPPSHPAPDMALTPAWGKSPFLGGQIDFAP